MLRIWPGEYVIWLTGSSCKMRVCKHRIKNLSGISCSLGISPMRCAFCQSFRAPSTADRHSADVGTLVIPKKVSTVSADEHIIPVSSDIILQAQTKGGCGCKKGSDG